MSIDAVPLLGALVLGYLLGSVPFGLVLTRAAGIGDLRSIGSGNIGATNVLRTGNKRLAAATLLLDALKGTAAVFIARYAWPDGDAGLIAGLVAGFGAFIGHCFPVWLGFSGGKGVATYVGIAAAAAWPVALLFAAVWVCVAALTRYSSLAALMATAIVPVALWITGNQPGAAAFGLMTVLSWAKHHQNISRLVGETESKIGAKG